MDTADFFATHPVFSHDAFATSTGAGLARSPRTIDSLLRNHIASGRILRVRRGLYATVPPGSDAATFQPDPFLLAGHLAPDAVVAYHAALQLRGKAYSVWHRFPMLVGGAVRPLQFRGNEFVVVHPPAHLRDRNDLGVVTERCAGGTVRVTTLERTLVDVLDMPALGGGWEEIWRSLDTVEYFDLDAVLAYALALESALTVARLGFYLEQQRERLFVEDLHLAQLAAKAPKQARYWDERRAPGKLVKPWNLIVPEQVLRGTWEEPDEAEAQHVDA